MPSVWRQQFHVAIALRNALRSRRAHHDISDYKPFRELTTCYQCSGSLNQDQLLQLDFYFYICFPIKVRQLVRQTPC